jgi:hypothetical protein
VRGVGPVGENSQWSSFKRYFSSRNEHPDVHLYRHGTSIAGVEVLRDCAVQSGGRGFSDEDTVRYMKGRQHDLEAKSSIGGGSMTGLRFVFNTEGHAVIYNPSLIRGDGGNAEPRFNVIERDFPSSI